MRLLTQGTLEIRERFEPIHYSPTLTERGSTATMVCGLWAPEIAAGDWIAEDEADGGIVWRVAAAEKDRIAGTTTYSLEHIVQTLGDVILPGEYGPGDIVSGAGSVTVRQAAEWCLAHQTLWQLGDCAFSSSAP